MIILNPNIRSDPLQTHYHMITRPEWNFNLLTRNPSCPPKKLDNHQITSLRCDNNYLIGAAVHAGKPSMQKSEKIIFLNKANNVVVTTDKVDTWLHLEGNIIKSWKISQKSWKLTPPPPLRGPVGQFRGHFAGFNGLKSKSWRKQTPIKIKFYVGSVLFNFLIWGHLTNGLLHAWPPYIYQRAVYSPVHSEGSP